MTETVIKAIINILVGAAWGSLVAFVSHLQKKVKKQKEETDALKSGLQSLLRADIIQSYEKYEQKGYCPIYARETLELEYKAYHELGGNGVITKLIENIRQMPVK